jgi:hypothetical protein
MKDIENIDKIEKDFNIVPISIQLKITRLRSLR